jgi:hypothetical protein
MVRREKAPGLLPICRADCWRKELAPDGSRSEELGPGMLKKCFEGSEQQVLWRIAVCETEEALESKIVADHKEKDLESLKARALGDKL